jgi:hypothetical protein
MDVRRGIENSKRTKEPENHHNDHDDVKNRFDFLIHGYEDVDQIQDDPDRDQNQCDTD